MKNKKKQNWTLLYGRLIKYADPGKRGLAMAEKAVLDAIAEHMGDKRVAWPGYGTIAHMAGCDRATAIRTVAKLTARGILSVAPTDDQESNRYQIDGKALGQLITKKKYQTRTQKLLARLTQTAVRISPALSTRTSIRGVVGRGVRLPCRLSRPSVRA